MESPPENVDFGDQLLKSGGADVPVTAEQVTEAQAAFEHSAGVLVSSFRTWSDPRITPCK